MHNGSLDGWDKNHADWFLHGEFNEVYDAAYEHFGDLAADCDVQANEAIRKAPSNALALLNF